VPLSPPPPIPQQDKAPDTTYEALIETPESGDWTTITLPWHDFVPVKSGVVDPEGEPLTVSGTRNVSGGGERDGRRWAVQSGGTGSCSSSTSP